MPIKKFCTLFFGISVLILIPQSNLNAQVKNANADSIEINRLNQVGKEFIIDGDYEKADSVINIALRLSLAETYNRGMFNSYNQLGICFWYRANFPIALQYHLKALKTAEEINDPFLIARSQANTALIFISQKEYKKALLYYTKALRVREKIRDDKGVSAILNNIGSIYEKQNDTVNAMKFYIASLENARKQNHLGMIALDLTSIAGIYTIQGQPEKAMQFYKDALSIAEKLDDKVLIAETKTKLAEIFIHQKKYLQTETFLQDALRISMVIGNLENQREVNKKLSELYATLNKWKLSYEHHLKSTNLKDSIYNETKTKDMVKNEMNFDFEKRQTIERKEQEIKDAISSEELKKKRMQRNYLIVGFCLMLVVTGIIFRSYRQKQKDNQIIALQKTEVEKQREIVMLQKQSLETHQKDIIDSITYAKRLQEAILPPQTFINRYIPENFIYYKPKDLVAGDFYWAENMNDLFFIAAADSTGHGVPGCMVSVVCSNALNRSIKEFKITDPGKILDKTRELVVETFAKSAEDVKDGMDISMLCIDHKNKTIQWSGANNPLWYLQNETGVIKEIKGDKQPIGKTENPKPFTTHAITYCEGSIFYLFTDGFADQFGGSNGKKFKYKPFAELLFNNHTLPLTDQKNNVDEAFQQWKQDLEQVDDVCVLAIKI